VKVTVVVDEAGKVVAAHIPTAPPDDYEGDEPPMIEFVPSEGEEVVELDIPDEDVASDPEPEVLEILQRHKDRSSWAGRRRTRGTPRRAAPGAHVAPTPRPLTPARVDWVQATRLFLPP
jgi:hypothetical protein